MAGERDTANQVDTRLHYMREALKMVRTLLPNLASSAKPAENNPGRASLGLR